MTKPFELYDQISDISFFIELLPVVLYLIFRKRINDKVLQVILLLVLVGFLIDLFTIHQVANAKNSLTGNNIFTLFETLVLGYFFTRILFSKLAKRIIYTLLIAFTTIWLLYFIKEGSKVYLEICVNIEAILILGFSIYYLYEQVTKPDSPFIYIHPRFWIVVGYLLYAAGTFFLFLFLNSLGKEDQKKYYLLNSIFLILKTIFISIAMLMKNDKIERKKFELH